MSDILRRLQLRLGYEFVDSGLLEQALTHRSFGPNHFERFEYLGDALLSAIIAEQLFHQFPKGREGRLTRLRASLVKKETLAEIAAELDLGPCLNLGSGELKSGGRRRPSILADTLEAVIGAIYLDSGFQVCQQAVLQWYAQRLDGIEIGAEQRDPKTRLQEMLQSQQRPLPEYRLLEGPITDAPGGEPQFRVGCRVAELDQEITAAGPSRRLAEQAAAQMALEQVSSHG